MTSIARRAAVLLPLLLAPALLTACSSAGSATPGSGVVASAKDRASAIASAEGRSSAPAAFSAVTSGDSLCSLVSVGDAAAAMKTDPTVTVGVASSGPDNEPTCTFGSDDRTTIGVIVMYGDAEHDPYRAPKPILGTGDMTALDGLGHRAATNGTEVDVDLGDHTLVVETFGSKDVSRDQLIALTKLFVAKL